MPKTVGMKCCKCGTKETRWWYRDYNSKKEWTGLRICYDCKLNKEKEENRKLKERIVGVRKCVKCGSAETYVTSAGYECWAKCYDRDGEWDKKSYMCNLCYQRAKQEVRSYEIECIKNERFKERKCIKCESIDTPHWFMYHDENGNKTNMFICRNCYMKDYNKRSDSYNNIRKIVCNCRIDADIDLSKFDEFSERIRGRIGEDIVSCTLEIDNHNDISNNYNSLYDLVYHHTYGRIEVKTASFGINNNSWDSTLDTEHNFDTLVILCMSKEKPWRHVKMVYIIPEDCSELYGKRYVSIYENPSRESKWDKFRVDAKPYNDTYHKMDMYIKFFGEQMEET
jgi:hypothetical protein